MNLTQGVNRSPAWDKWLKTCSTHLVVYLIVSLALPAVLRQQKICCYFVSYHPWQPQCQYLSLYKSNLNVAGLTQTASSFPPGFPCFVLYSLPALMDQALLQRSHGMILMVLILQLIEHYTQLIFTIIMWLLKSVACIINNLGLACKREWILMKTYFAFVINVNHVVEIYFHSDIKWSLSVSQYKFVF